MDTASTQRTGWFARLMQRGDARDLAPLYRAVVAEARRPAWYADFGVPDTIDGRFDMVALVLSLVLIRLDYADDPRAAVRLTEAFIDDMDGQMREIGFGDLVVGKKVGGIVAALGGRLGNYRGAFDEAVLVRNVWRGQPPDAARVAALRGEADALRARIDALPVWTLLAGRLA